jgi:uncharacterized protein (TIRG00374 family)
MKKTLQITIGLIVSAVCLWITFRGFNFSELRSEVADYRLGWAFPAAVVYCLSFALRSARWKWILSSVKPMKYRTVAPVLVFGFFMNSVLPARAGELARAFAIAKKGDIPVSSSLGSIVAERTTDLFGLIVMMLLASRLLPWDKLPVGRILIAAGVMLVLMLLLTVVLPRMKVSQSGPLQKVISFVAQLGAGFSVIKKPSKVVGLVFISVAIWLSDATSVLILSRASGLDFSLVQTAALMVGIAVGVMIPAAPGYVGTYELFGKQILTMVGFAATPALTFVLFLHFFQMVMVTLLGLPATIAIGLQGKRDAA